MYTRCLTILDKTLEAAGGRYFADQRFIVADLKAYVWMKRLRSCGLDHVPSDLAGSVAPRLVQHMGEWLRSRE